MTVRCCPSPTSPTRSCSSRCSVSPPVARGSRSSPVSPPTSRISRRSAPVRWPRGTVRPDQAGPLQRRAPRRTKRQPRRPSNRHRGARGAPCAARVGPHGHAAGAHAARRIQSPPRGRPHALRRRTLVSSSPSLAELATGVALVVHPSDLSRIGVSAEGDDVRVTTPRGTATLPVLADSATAPGHRVHGVRPGWRRRPQRHRRHRRRRSPSSAWRPPGDDADDRTARAHRPAVRRRRRHHRRADHHRQDDRGVRAAAAVGPDVHLVPAQGHRQDAEPRRPRPRRALRSAPEPRRRHQALLQGAVGAQHRRPAHLPTRALPRAAAGVPRVQHRAHRRPGHHRRPRDVPAARRPPVRDPVAARDVGPRALRRVARRLGIGFQVPAARLGARVGAAAQLRSRVRARHRRRAGAVEHAVDPPASSSSRAGTASSRSSTATGTGCPRSSHS